MLIQDALTGRLHEIPDQFHGSYLGEYGQLYEPQWGEYPQGYGYSPQYGAGQVVYDGLGNPVGIFPLLTALAPLAAKVLPKLAQKVLPFAQKVLPKLAQRFFPGAAQRFLPVINQALPAISNMFREPTPALGQATAPMMDPQRAPMPGAPLPASMPMSIHPPAPRVMGPMVHPMMRWRRRRRCRCVNVIRHHIPVPPPPAVRQPIREAVKAEPAGAVQGWGYYGGFNGYGRW